MEHSGLGSAMWVFGTRSSHFLYRKPRLEVAPHGATSSRDVVALRHRYSQCLGKMLDSKRITGDHSVPYLRNVNIQWD